jgi:putative transposase
MWDNPAHRHTGLGLLTPHDVDHSLAEQRVAERAVVLATAYAAHPERFPAGRPAPPARPTEVCIAPLRPERRRRRSYTKLMTPLSHSY